MTRTIFWLDQFLRSLPTYLPTCAGSDCVSRKKSWTHFWHGAHLQLNGVAFCRSCWERAAQRELKLLRFKAEVSARLPLRMPLGLLLLANGVLTDGQLRHALELQRGSEHRKLGDWLIELGYVSEDEITAGLSMQWGCPVYPLKRTDLPATPLFLPKTLLETSRLIPVHVEPAKNTAYLAFLDRVDYTLLYSIERMTGYRTLPCVASPSHLRRALTNLSNSLSHEEVVFDERLSDREIARIAYNYAEATNATNVRIASCSQVLWVRCLRASASTDLLFRIGDRIPSN